MSDTIQTAPGTMVFVAKQSAKGTPATLTGSNYIPITSISTNAGSTEFIPSPEIAAERQARAGSPGRGAVQTVELGFILRVPGSAGSAPIGDPILENAFGVKTVNAGTSVVYTPTETFALGNWLTVAMKRGNVVAWVVDGQVGTLQISLPAENLTAVTANISGLSYMYAGEALTDAEIDGTGTPVTEVVLAGADDWKRYTVGAKIYIGTDTNSGSGFTVTDVDSATSTLTVTPGIATLQAAGSTVGGFLPTPVEAGNMAKGFLGGVTLASAPWTLREFSIEIDNAISPAIEITGTSAIDNMTAGTRSVSMTASVFQRGDYLDRLSDFNQDVRLSNVSAITSYTMTAGNRAKIDMPTLQLSAAPALSVENTGNTFPITANATGTGSVTLTVY